MDNGDGTWSHIVPANLDPDAVVAESILTWAYVGQAVYSWDPQPISGEQVYIATEDVQESVADQLLGTRRTRDGQTWEVVAVDQGALDTTLAAQRAESDETEVVGAQGAQVAAEVPGSVHSWFPQSWSLENCDLVGGPLFATDGDNHFWDGDDDRVAIDSTYSFRRKSVVEIAIGVNQPVAVCTGVIIRAQWVLTAAHCVVDDNGFPYSANEVKVFRRDEDSPPDWLPVDQDPIIADDYTGPPPDPKDDYALLHMTFAFDTPQGAGTVPYGDMDLSVVNDATIESIATPNNYALPKYAPGCASNINLASGSPINLYLNEDELLGDVFPKKLNIKMDGGPGHSGSPVFYCPGGCTGSVANPPENKAYILAVWSGWDGVATTHVGPKVASFADWAFGIMDSN